MSNEDLCQSEIEELEAMEAESLRPRNPAKMELEVFDAVRGQSLEAVQPVRLKPEDNFNFHCHKGVSCWNKCCHGADITLTPGCILVLSRHLKLKPAEFLAQYTVPSMHDRADLPVAKLKMGGDDGKGGCPFVTAEGCSIYSARPATCRYYPLGVVSIKMKESETKEDFNFLVKESHCRGHDETRSVSVGEYRNEQGVEWYEMINRGWVDILMKLASWNSLGGPLGKPIELPTKRMFFMATTDVQAFRRFVFETKFLESYDIDPEAVEILKTDDEALLLLAYDWLKTVLFHESTILLKEQVLQRAIAGAREELGAT